MNITLPDKDTAILRRVTDDYNFALAAIGTSLRWSPEDLALRILKDGIKNRSNFLPESNVHHQYPK